MSADRQLCVAMRRQFEVNVVAVNVTARGKLIALATVAVPAFVKPGHSHNRDCVIGGGLSWVPRASLL